MKILILVLLCGALVPNLSCGGDRIAGSDSSNQSQLPKSSANPPRGSRETCLNLNTASAEELLKLPGIGEVIARRIVDYRERQGRFRRAEEIIIVEGFSENKYRAIESLVCAN